MRFIRTVVPASLLLLLLFTPTSAITNGELDGDGHPCVGAILVDLDDELFPPAEGWPDYWLLCSGTLIDWDGRDDVFLTAAHCTTALDNYVAWGYCGEDDIFVCFEENALDDPDTYVPVEEHYTHPDFEGKLPLRYDVGVCVLDTSDVDDMPEPAILADVGYLDDLDDAKELKGGPKKVKFTVVGYGCDLTFPPPRPTAIDGDRRVAESGFLSLHELHLFLLQNQAAGQSGTGYGDSGGPAFWNDGEDEILVAVTSWGDPNLVATGIYHRADIVETQDFLSDVLD